MTFLFIAQLSLVKFQVQPCANTGAVQKKSVQAPSSRLVLPWLQQQAILWGNSRRHYCYVANAADWRDRMRRKGGIATWVLTCQNQNGVVIDRGNQVNNLRPPRLQQGRAQESRRKGKVSLSMFRFVFLFSRHMLPVMASCSLTLSGPGHLMVSGIFELWAWATRERILRKDIRAGETWLWGRWAKRR